MLQSLAFHAFTVEKHVLLLHQKNCSFFYSGMKGTTTTQAGSPLQLDLVHVATLVPSLRSAIHDHPHKIFIMNIALGVLLSSKQLLHFIICQLLTQSGEQVPQLC